MSILDKESAADGASADSVEVKNVVVGSIEEDSSKAVWVVFDEGHSLEERILAGQFDGNSPSLICGFCAGNIFTSYRPQAACLSRIRLQAVIGSWTKPRQWDTQCTSLSSARLTVSPTVTPKGVLPANDAWTRAAL